MSTILVIDDKDSMREMLTASLTSEGYDVEVAGSGDVGIAKSKEKHFDVILTDLKMPDISGMDVLTQVKENDPDTAVIVMTAYGTIETAVEAMKRGAFDFLQKPFDINHLQMLVERALGESATGCGEPAAARGIGAVTWVFARSSAPPRKWSRSRDSCRKSRHLIRRCC